MTVFTLPTDEEMKELVAKLRAEFRAALAPILPHRDHLLAVPVWTRPVAVACKLPVELLERLAETTVPVKALYETKFMTSRLDGRLNYETGAFTYHEYEDREFRLADRVRKELLALVLEDPHGRQRLSSCVALCAEDLERAGLTYFFRDWPALAKLARDPLGLVAAMNALVVGFLERESSGDALRVIETGRLLVETLDDVRIAHGCDAAAQKLNDYHDMRRRES